MGFISVFGKSKPHGKESQYPDALGMAQEIYPQRPYFKDAVRDLRLSRKITLAGVAELLGITLDTLHDYLYKKHIRPGRLPLLELSRLTGRPMADFEDDPGSPPPGSTPETPEIERFMLRVMGSDLSRLSDSQKQSAFEAWRAIVKGYEPPK